MIKILIRKTPYIVKPLDIIQTILLSHIFILVYIYNKQLCRFSKLKLIYFHNDILVSDTFVIACHINNIATISHQERPHSSVWSNLLIFNHYFICGPKFKKIYSDRGNCIEYYHNIGLFRSSYIKNAVKKSKYEQLYDGSKYKHLLVCFDTLPLGYFDAGLYGNDVSEDSVKEFYDVLYKLSITLIDVFILI